MTRNQIHSEISHSESCLWEGILQGSAETRVRIVVKANFKNFRQRTYVFPKAIFLAPAMFWKSALSQIRYMTSIIPCYGKVKIFKAFEASQCLQLGRIWPFVLQLPKMFVFFYIQHQEKPQIFALKSFNETMVLDLQI